MKTKPNIGRIDQIIRLVVGALLLLLTATQTIGLWGLIGILPIISGLRRDCFLYRLFGISTCKTK